MFRHGLRVSEAVDLRWDQVDFKAGSIHINRLKNGKPATQYVIQVFFHVSIPTHVLDSLEKLGKVTSPASSLSTPPSIIPRAEAISGAKKRSSL